MDMCKPKTIILLILMLSGSSLLFAQNRIITGKVTGSDTGETLPAASVKISGTNRGAVTDMDGNYRIEVIPGDVSLKFSYMGYDAREIEIGNQTVINVALHTTSNLIGDVVVNGYGGVRKSDLT
ncbi:MAG: carboxypeptidase-like regulatory domain-containing protein, partial [Bacteroidales bacterium]|nr:carboxypeptidase-like regulatory domain-containing protein [Bacteroidales bacterium]